MSGGRGEVSYVGQLRRRQVRGLCLVHGRVSVSRRDGNEVSEGSGRPDRCRGLFLFTSWSQLFRRAWNSVRLGSKQLDNCRGLLCSPTGLNAPYVPRGDIRPRARHSQAGVSQLRNGTAHHEVQVGWSTMTKHSHFDDWYGALRNLIAVGVQKPRFTLV